METQSGGKGLESQEETEVQEVGGWVGGLPLGKCQTGLSGSKQILKRTSRPYGGAPVLEERFLGLGALSLRGAVKYRLGQEVTPKLALCDTQMKTLLEAASATGVGGAEERPSSPGPRLQGVPAQRLRGQEINRSPSWILHPAKALRWHMRALSAALRPGLGSLHIPGWDQMGHSYL